MKVGDLVRARDIDGTPLGLIYEIIPGASDTYEFYWVQMTNINIYHHDLQPFLKRQLEIVSESR